MEGVARWTDGVGDDAGYDEVDYQHVPDKWRVVQAFYVGLPLTRWGREPAGSRDFDRGDGCTYGPV